MALPASRVIGHREYGNTPPPLGNGWAGRKTDPIYSMDWRRQRVAAFRPRTATVGSTPTPRPTPKPAGGFPMALTDAQQAQLVKDVADIKAAVGWLDDAVINGNTAGQTLRNVDNRTVEIRTLLQVLAAKIGEPVQATVDLSAEDVAALAESLRAGLAPEVVRALGEKLTAA